MRCPICVSGCLGIGFGNPKMWFFRFWAMPQMCPKCAVWWGGYLKSQKVVFFGVLERVILAYRVPQIAKMAILGGSWGVPKSTLIISVTGLPRGTLPICSKPGPGGELVSVPDFHIWGGGVPTFRGPQILHAHQMCTPPNVHVGQMLAKYWVNTI